MNTQRFVESLYALAKTSEPSAGPLTDEEQDLVDELGEKLARASSPEQTDGSSA